MSQQEHGFLNMAMELFRRAPVAVDSTHTGLEIVPWCLFSTAVYRSKITTRLDFFRVQEAPQQTSLYIPSMLPEPQSFLIKSIKIFGLTTALAMGTFEMFIGNKHYAKRPGWLTQVRPGFAVDPPLFLGAAVHFAAYLEWLEPVQVYGLDGQPKQSAVIQLAFLGQLARPLQ